MSDASSLCKGTKEVVGEIYHTLMNIRKEFFHSLSGCYFQGSLGPRPNAIINTINTMVEKDNLTQIQIHIYVSGEMTNSIVARNKKDSSRQRNVIGGMLNLASQEGSSLIAFNAIQALPK